MCTTHQKYTISITSVAVGSFAVPRARGSCVELITSASRTAESGGFVHLPDSAEKGWPVR